jgi:hypothetical protein
MMFILARNGKQTKDANTLCKTADHQLCVWHTEAEAEAYAMKYSKENWMVRKATSEDFALVGSMKKNRFNTIRPAYKIMGDKPVIKKTTSSGSLVEIFEDYEARRFAIASKAESEKEFVLEAAQVLSSTGTVDWNTRLKEFLPLIVDLCCKYRGHKAETVIERRELVAGDLEMPKK